MSGRRGQVFTPRWGQATIKPRNKRFSTVETVAYLNRVTKRANKAAGYDSTKQPNTWVYRVLKPGLGVISGSVFAHTRSEARARIKEELEVPKNKRLPKDVVIEKVENDERE